MFYVSVDDEERRSSATLDPGDNSSNDTLIGDAPSARMRGATIRSTTSSNPDGDFDTPPESPTVRSLRSSQAELCSSREELFALRKTKSHAAAPGQGTSNANFGAAAAFTFAAEDGGDAAKPPVPPPR